MPTLTVGKEERYVFLIFNLNQNIFVKMMTWYFLKKKIRLDCAELSTYDQYFCSMTQFFDVSKI